jgi:hypothetical protein
VRALNLCVQYASCRMFVLGESTARCLLPLHFFCWSTQVCKHTAIGEVSYFTASSQHTKKVYYFIYLSGKLSTYEHGVIGKQKGKEKGHFRDVSCMDHTCDVAEEGDILFVTSIMIRHVSYFSNNFDNDARQDSKMLQPEAGSMGTACSRHSRRTKKIMMKFGEKDLVPALAKKTI